MLAMSSAGALEKGPGLIHAKAARARNASAAHAHSSVTAKERDRQPMREKGEVGGMESVVPRVCQKGDGRL